MPLLVFFTNNTITKQTVTSMKLKKFNHSKELPQFYTATILDWKMPLKSEKYKMIIIESLFAIVGVFTNNLSTQQTSEFMKLKKFNSKEGSCHCWCFSPTIQ